MSSSLTLATLDDLKLRLGVKDSRDDAQMQAFLALLEARFEAHLNRVLARGSETQFFDGGVRRLLLRRFPVETATVWLDPDRRFGEDTLLANGYDYVLDAERGALVWGVAFNCWPETVAGIKVEYVGGYRAAGSSEGQFAAPAALTAAFLMQAEYEWRNREHLGRQSIGAQGQSLSLAPAKLLPEVEAAIAPFVRR